MLRKQNEGSSRGDASGEGGRKEKGSDKRGEATGGVAATRVPSAEGASIKDHRCGWGTKKISKGEIGKWKKGPRGKQYGGKTRLLKK